MVKTTKLDQALLIYGAGNKGRDVCRRLQQAGWVIRAFVDAAAGEGQACENLPVYTPEKWLAAHGPQEHCPILLAIHNPGVDVASLLCELRVRGFVAPITLVSFYARYPGLLPDHYWLTDPGFYTAHAEKIARLRLLLADEASRRLLDAVIALRLYGDFGLLPFPRPEDQYMPADLPRWPSPLRFVDCGAFRGETIRALAGAGYEFEAIAAFEPDPDNFAALVVGLRAYQSEAFVVSFPCGVSARTEMLHFDAGHGASSAVSEAGTTYIQCVALDEVLAGFRPNLVKMDIEGAEPDALRGARGLIESQRPGLAISVYHHPTHLWDIPHLLAEWGCGYRFFLRIHAFNTFDLVLYALPD